MATNETFELKINFLDSLCLTVARVVSLRSCITVAFVRVPKTGSDKTVFGKRSKTFPMCLTEFK